MIEQRFYSAFKVEVFHSYFENGNCNCVQFKLDSRTAQLLNRFGFRIRKLSNGFELQNNSVSIVNLLAYITQATGISSFNFDLITTDENFINYTDFPIDCMGQLQYDTNSNKNTNDQEVTTLYPTFNAEPYTTKLGTLTVHFKELIKRIAGKESLLFKINYVARSTQWQYYIVNRSSVYFNNPKIVGKSGIEFQGPAHTIIATGEAALLFSSSGKLIPLSKLSVYTFDLVDEQNIDQKNGAVKTIVKGLPNPKVSQIECSKNEIKLVASPMYVYV